MTARRPVVRRGGAAGDGSILPALAGLLVALAVTSVPASGTAAAGPQRWSVLPVMGYSTETTLFVGGMAIHYLPQRPQTRGSSIPTVGFGSLKGQYQVFVVPDLYTVANTYRLEGALGVQKWPASYYRRGNGAGPETVDYQANGIELELSAQRRFGGHRDSRGGFFAGPLLRVVLNEVSWKESGSCPIVAGADGGALVGIGLATSYDTRDVPGAPLAGDYVTYTLGLHHPWMGSDYDYTLHLLEARHYHGLGHQRVLAVGGDLRLISGAPPFREQSSPDGIGQLRGIENGRYHDTHLLSLQVEYRQPLRGRTGGVVYLDAAQVAPRVGSLSLDAFHFAPGMGLRFALNPEQRFNLRFDVSWVDGGPGVVFTAGEAF